MSEQFSKLKEFIAEELAIYRQLLGLCKHKQKLLLEKFSTELLKIVSEEEKLIQRLTEVEDGRAGCVESLTGDRNTSLDEVIEKITDTAIKSDIWIQASNLKEVIGEIRDINERNQKLLEQALELTRYSISLLTRPPREITYRPPGTKGTASISKLVDKKA